MREIVKDSQIKNRKTQFYLLLGWNHNFMTVVKRTFLEGLVNPSKNVNTSLHLK